MGRNYGNYKKEKRERKEERRTLEAIELKNLLQSPVKLCVEQLHSKTGSGAPRALHCNVSRYSPL